MEGGRQHFICLAAQCDQIIYTETFSDALSGTSSKALSDGETTGNPDEGKQKKQATEAGTQESCPGNHQTQMDEEAKGKPEGSAENLRSLNNIQERDITKEPNGSFQVKSTMTE